MEIRVITFSLYSYLVYFGCLYCLFDNEFMFAIIFVNVIITVSALV